MTDLSGFLNFVLTGAALCIAVGVGFDFMLSLIHDRDRSGGNF